MIVQELCSLGGGLHSRSALIFTYIFSLLISPALLYNFHCLFWTFPDLCPISSRLLFMSNAISPGCGVHASLMLFLIHRIGVHMNGLSVQQDILNWL